MSYVLKIGTDNLEYLAFPLAIIVLPGIENAFHVLLFCFH